MHVRNLIDYYRGRLPSQCTNACIETHAHRHTHTRNRHSPTRITRTHHTRMRRARACTELAHAHCSMPRTHSLILHNTTHSHSTPHYTTHTHPILPNHSIIPYTPHTHSITHGTSLPTHTDYIPYYTTPCTRTTLYYTTHTHSMPSSTKHSYALLAHRASNRHTKR